MLGYEGFNFIYEVNVQVANSIEINIKANY